MPTAQLQKTSERARKFIRCVYFVFAHEAGLRVFYSCTGQAHTLFIGIMKHVTRGGAWENYRSFVRQENRVRGPQVAAAQERRVCGTPWWMWIFNCFVTSSCGIYFTFGHRNRTCEYLVPPQMKTYATQVKVRSVLLQALRSLLALAIIRSVSTPSWALRRPVLGNVPSTAVCSLPGVFRLFSLNRKRSES
jgi:hypothetical protein